ncbi:MAG TPA: hypothetical protein VNT22_06310 [Baekduia sp.]|nr:hypothetical protein [Baekduia sp.]
MAQRISIGIDSSPPVGLRVSDEQLAALLDALGSDGWHDLEGEDGTLRVNLAKISWLKVENDEARVGFGLSS